MKKNKTIWIVAGLLLLVCLIIFKDYLNFKWAYYFFDISSDGFYSTYPFLYNAAEICEHHQIPQWSFKYGMGQNIFPFLLRDPFDIILYAAGKDSILYLTIYIEVLKIFLTGIVFFKYLKLLNFSDGISIVGCLLLAFCGFVTETSPWFAFTFEAFNFVLLLYSLELYMARRKWFLFSFSIFLFCISMPFNLYLYGIFMFCYIVFRHLKKGKFNLKVLSGLFLRLSGMGLVGALLAGPFLLQNIWLLLHNPRGGDPNFIKNNIAAFPVFKLNHHFEFGTSIMRFFSNDILGSGDHYKGYESVFSAGEFYCGLSCLLLVPQLFIYLNKRDRLLHFVYLLIWLIPILFPFFRSALWMFTGPYFRSYSLLVAFVLIFYSINALQFVVKERRINTFVLALTLVVLFIFLYSLVFHYIMSNDRVDKMIQSFVAIMLVVYAIVFVLYTRTKKVNYLKYIFFSLILFEVCFSGWITANRRDAFRFSWLRNEKVMFNDNFKQSASYINSFDKSFYRIDKYLEPNSTRWTGLGANQAEGYFATSSYSPFNELYYVRYLQLMGVVNKNSEPESRWAIGLAYSPVLEIENRVKYYMGQNNSKPTWPELWDSIAHIGDVTIFRNNYVLPFGFTYDHYITENDYNILSAEQQRNVTTQAFVIADRDVSKVSGLKEFKIRDTISQLTTSSLKKNLDSLAKDTMSIVRFEETKIVGDYNLPSDKMVYLSIPYDDGWRLVVDSSESKPMVIDGGMMGVFLKKGKHHIELFYRLRFMLTGAMMSAAGLIILLLFNSKKFAQRRKAQTDAAEPAQESIAENKLIK